jgi:GNAT superfamily N-acetyltransferase
MTRAAAYEIAPARWPDDTDLARRLLRDYGNYLAGSPARVCLIGYEGELRALPGKYGGQQADLLLARVNDAGAGCVAVTRFVLKDGTYAVEMKRLWVEPDFRGLGLGRGLVNAAIGWAREQGCGAVVLDTVNEAMPEAALLYQSMGFAEIPRFNDNPVPGVRFYQLRLRG